MIIKRPDLLANPLQSSRSTFSWESFPNFFTFKEGMRDTQISTLLSSPTVSGRLALPPRPHAPQHLLPAATPRP
jgi:hypothetical protein